MIPPCIPDLSQFFSSLYYPVSRLHLSHCCVPALQKLSSDLLFDFTVYIQILTLACISFFNIPFPPSSLVLLGKSEPSVHSLLHTFVVLDSFVAAIGSNFYTFPVSKTTSSPSMHFASQSSPLHLCELAFSLPFSYMLI